MKRTRPIWLFGFALLTCLSCASRQPKVESYELKFKRIDHFMVNEFEVGALEFEPCILPGGYIPIYHFPVYVGGAKRRDFYVNVYGSPDQMDAFKFKKVSRKFLYQHEFLWVLEERTEEKLQEVLKRYGTAPSYARIKEDVIEILFMKR